MNVRKHIKSVKGVWVMLTIILISVVAMIALAITLLIASLSHPKLHNTDLMAGDEGDG